ncbi:unnamed protein product [Pieris macdunnoughi]|uniref:Uncharacterized protein n=1 Tax=Pieris macdunnoughi TaxID=345717 RepID=A0A821RD79_9NEOP|nr:unnamed protein product [Pieris macdunnoughi]
MFVLLLTKATHRNSPQGLLIEAAAITSVIARTSDREVFSAIQSDTALQRSGAALQRVHALMLTLLARFHVPPADIDSSDDCTLYYKVRF